MVVICHKYKFIIFKSYKTASTSIENFFSSLFKKKKMNPNEYIAGKHKMKNGVMITKHISPNELFKLMPEVKDYYKICPIRNPFTQIISCYLHNYNHIPNEEQLTKYITSCTYTPSTFKKIKKHFQHLRTYYSYTLYNGQKCIDFFIKLENLREDVLTVLNLFNIQDFNIDKLGNSRSSNIKYQIDDIYSPKNIKLVNLIFQEEMQLGNYSFPKKEEKELKQEEESLIS